MPSLPAFETVELHTGEALAPVPEPASYYYDLLEMRHIEREVKKALHSANEKLKTSEKDPNGALDVLRQTVMQLTAQKMGKQVADFRYSFDLIMTTFAQTLIQESIGAFKFGWPTLDDMSGGLGMGRHGQRRGPPAEG